MGVISKGIIFFNTIKYLKPEQLVNQVKFRLDRKEMFWSYRRDGVEHRDISLWMAGLDDDPVIMERFEVTGLVENNRLTLLNETREFDRWQYSDASHLWNFNVHYLEYLVPLFSLWKSSGDEKYKRKINQILDFWYEKGSYEPDSNQSYTISLRIINQLIIADAVDDKDKFYSSIYAQYRYLIRHQEKNLLGNHYLENLKAIVICNVVFFEEDVYKKYIKRLLEELEEQITEDGLHYELSLMYHKIILEDLIRVAVVLKKVGMKEYKDIVRYLKKMTTALYSLENGINQTLLFNDAGDNVAKTADSLINICQGLFGVKPEKKASMAGYHRLDDGKISVIFDCGELAPSYMPGHGHNDCLSFELFYDGKPIFVNCGTYQYQGDKRKFFRSTAAHNTVVINDHEQSELWGEHRAGRRIRGVCSKSENNLVIGSYRNYFGEKHNRKIRIENGVLDVIDKTSGDGKSYLNLAPGFRCEDGKILGNGLMLSISPINAEISKQQSLYAHEFGKIEDIECLVFSWNADDNKHGYRIKIEEQN